MLQRRSEKAAEHAKENERLAATTLNAGEWQVHVHILHSRILSMSVPRPRSLEVTRRLIWVV